MFKIEFLSHSAGPADEQQPEAMVLRGGITLGDFSETFFAPPSQSRSTRVSLDWQSR
jgi:hypothetical protein